jgi:hypothetical protein
VVVGFFCCSGRCWRRCRRGRQWHGTSSRASRCFSSGSSRGSSSCGGRTAAAGAQSAGVGRGQASQGAQGQPGARGTISSAIAASSQETAAGNSRCRPLSNSRCCCLAVLVKHRCLQPQAMPQVQHLLHAPQMQQQQEQQEQQRQVPALEAAAGDGASRHWRLARRTDQHRPQWLHRLLLSTQQQHQAHQLLLMMQHRPCQLRLPSWQQQAIALLSSQRPSLPQQSRATSASPPARLIVLHSSNPCSRNCWAQVQRRLPLQLLGSSHLLQALALPSR